MKDVRFYLEFPSVGAKHKSGKANMGHSGNVFAAFLYHGKGFTIHGSYTDEQGREYYEGLSSLLDCPNSPVCYGSANVKKFIRAQCKRIPESLARQIHPRLFERLDEKE